jgi:hypothetical protein
MCTRPRRVTPSNNPVVYSGRTGKPIKPITRIKGTRLVHPADPALFQTLAEELDMPVTERVLLEDLRGRFEAAMNFSPELSHVSNKVDARAAMKKNKRFDFAVFRLQGNHIVMRTCSYHFGKRMVHVKTIGTAGWILDYSINTKDEHIERFVKDVADDSMNSVFYYCQ